MMMKINFNVPPHTGKELDYIKECPGTIPGYILVVAVFLLLAVMARYIIIVLAINNYMHKTTILKHFINCFCGMAIYMAFLVVDYFVVKYFSGTSICVEPMYLPGSPMM